MRKALEISPDFLVVSVIIVLKIQSKNSLVLLEHGDLLMDLGVQVNVIHALSGLIVQLMDAQHTLIVKNGNGVMQDLKVKKIVLVDIIAIIILANLVLAQEDIIVQKQHLQHSHHLIDVKKAFTVLQVLHHNKNVLVVLFMSLILKGY
jgi:hypothetical protein